MAEQNQGMTFESGQIPTYEEFKGRYQPDFKSYLGREQKEDFAKQQYDTFVQQAQETGDPETVYQDTISGVRGSEEYQMYVDQGLIDAETGQYVSQEEQEEQVPPSVMDLSEVPQEELDDLVQFVPEGFGSNQVFQALNNAFVNALGRPVGKEGTRYWTGELRRLMEDEGKTFTEAANQIGSIIQNSAEAKAFKETGIASQVDQENMITGVPYGGTPITSVTAGTPTTVSEANVADVMGLQAVTPTLAEGTELESQIKEIDPEAEGTEQVLAEDYKIDTEENFVATPEELTANTVDSPTPQEAITKTAQTTDLVDQPEVAKMTAQKSLEQINIQADALQAATQDLNEIDPRATVQGQLAILNKQFEDGNVPVWAQGALKTANSLMAQRGLGSSSIAAETITNALMQSTIPIAQQDASFYQNVTIQNLSNEQQVEMAKFNSRVNAIFNDQAAENAARNLNTQSENDMARFFTELSQNVALTNTAQTNAMEQFNATAQNQMNQFMAELDLTAETFNADALNEMSQFDAEQANIIAQFNASMKDQRERFNVQNQLAIDASNVQWRRDVNTANTSATNAALQFDAQNLLGIQQTALNNIWQHYDTLLNFAFQAEESDKDRAQNLLLTTMSADLQRQIAAEQADSGLISDLITGGVALLATESGNNVLRKFGVPI